MATLRQKVAFKNTLENRGNVSSAMRISGYSDAYSKNPQQLTESVGWKQLLDQDLADNKLTLKNSEGLDAIKHYKGTDEPDHYIRHMFLETALKLKNKFPKEQTGYQDIPITLNVYGNDKRLAARLDRLHATGVGQREAIPGTELAQESQEDHSGSSQDGVLDTTDT